MYEIKLFLDQSKINKKGLAPLSLTSQFKGRTVKISAGISIAPAHFNVDHQSLHPKTPNVVLMRDRIQELTKQFTSALAYFDKLGMVPTNTEITNRIQQQVEPEQAAVKTKRDERIVPFFAEFKRISAKRRKPSYLRTFNQVEGHLKNFSTSLTWAMLTEKKLDEYTDFLVDNELSNATIHNHIKNLKVVAGEARKQGFVVPDAIDNYTYKGERTRPISLTKAELDALIQTKPAIGSGMWKAYVRWLFRCYTSLRISECDGLSAKNFHKEGGEWVVRYTSAKTGKENILPISTPCVDILESCGWRIPAMSRQGESDYMKELCRQAGINTPIVKVRHSGINRVEETIEKWKVVSSHTARRTFGKRFIEEGGSLFDLQIIYQHDSIKTTADYIDMTITDLLKNSKGIMNRI
ncbi:tyrosine-type recombinase/integrase [Spirosoma sordidisoli]|uniref:Tyr recombinase domain-containing protein n=1 Tax=Spirosoma sordidisoli TaxID=2502893 RepID=A0A4Q2USB4_9BACT|nr:tyrosine-type recombinase/integrase [Spirosoma sordidisoli]RYC70761.1 hypothetical protein EQG79_00990 [Spirosoma sordidisoli]